jgi:hypothetical protein
LYSKINVFLFLRAFFRKDDFTVPALSALDSKIFCKSSIKEKEDEKIEDLIKAISNDEEEKNIIIPIVAQNYQ